MIRATMIGRVGKDAEVKEGSKGKYVTLDVATDIFHQGENKTDWVRVYCNNPKTIQNVEEKGLFKKGSMIEVQGSMTFPSAWISKVDGTPHAQSVLLAEWVQYAGGRKKEEKPADNATSEKAANPAAGGKMPFEAPNQNDEDLPF